GEGVIQVVHTDDTATKLSDRVKGRFLNCCPTLNSFSQLCNKYGLFEHMHSRPRPEQLPHKRGLL
ncbi:hypothetical protein B0H13DRAFT_1456847, partial [Mycena leptocephala]